MEANCSTGYPHIDKPWLKYYPQEAIDAKLPEGSLYDFLYENNKEHYSDIALNYFGKKTTYGEFFGRIEQCAKALQASGVKKGDIVSVCMLTMPETLVLLYGINRVGAVCNFLVLNATEQELHKQIQNTESKLVFSVNLAAEKVAAAMKNTAAEQLIVVPLTESMPALTGIVAGLKARKLKTPEGAMQWKVFLRAGEGKILSPVRVESNDLAVLEYTSGTTGESKGVMLSNQNINTVTFHYSALTGVFDIDRGEQYLSIVPPFLAFGIVSAMIMPLTNGVMLILCPDPNPKMTAKRIRKYKPEHFIGGVLHVQDIMEDPFVKNMDLSFMKTIAYGGDVADSCWEEDVNMFFHDHRAPYRVLNGYGMTEVAASFCTSTHKVVSQIPLVKNNVMICDLDTHAPLTYGETGEICVTGPSLMQGYYKNKTATNDVIFEQEGVRWIRTGDIGRVDADGSFHVTGRIKRILHRVGADKIEYRVYPMKIEEVVAALLQVKQCAVVGRKDPKEAYVPILFIVLQQGEEKCDELIFRTCQEKLDSVSQPVEIRYLDALPVTRAGKVDFNKLEKIVNQEIDELLD